MDDAGSLQDYATLLATLRVSRHGRDTSLWQARLEELAAHDGLRIEVTPDHHDGLVYGACAQFSDVPTRVLYTMGWSSEELRERDAAVDRWYAAVAHALPGVQRTLDARDAASAARP